MCDSNLKLVLGLALVKEVYSGTSLLGTLWDLKFSPYYRGFLNSEDAQYTTVLHWDTEWCPYYRGFHCVKYILYLKVPSTCSHYIQTYTV